MNIRQLIPELRCPPFDYSSIPELNDPQYQQVSWCDDTPENWKRFHRLKYLIVSGLATQADAPSEKQLQQAWKDLEQDPP